MQQNKTSDLSESMTEAIDTFVLEFLDFFMSFTHDPGQYGSIQEYWATCSKEEKQSLIASTRQYGREIKAKKNETCPDCELAEKLIPGIVKEIKDAR